MIDIIDNEQGDLDLSTGDLMLQESTRSHQADILLSAQGDWCETPLLGVGIIDYINDNDPSGLLSATALQMQDDGMDVERIEFNEKGEIEIDAEYENNSSQT